MCCELKVGNLGEHRVGQVLHHELKPCHFCPAGSQDGSGLSLAGLESHAGPAKPHAQTDHSPIVGALIEKQRLPGAHRMNIDPVPFEVVGKGLLDIENTPEDGWLILRKVIENLVHVFRIEHGAVEIGREMLHPVVRSDAGHRDETLIIPVGIVAPQFDFQAF